MAEILTVLHECVDFERWKPVFDADAPNRKAAGLTDLFLLRQTDKPNLIALVMGVSDRSRAQVMVASPQLRDAMQKGGIIGKPEMHFRQGDLDPQQAPQYLSLNCKIRDVATFRKGYAMDKAKVDAFLSSPTLAEHQVKNAGVVGPPTLRYWTPG